MFGTLKRWLGFGPHEATLQERIAEKSARLEERLLEAQLNWFDNLVDLREPFYDTQDFWFPVGASEQVPPNIDGRKRGEALPVYTTEFGLKMIRDQCRRLHAYNEFAINGAENRVSYIVGKGFAYKAVPKKKGGDEKLAVQVQLVIDAFIHLNSWGEREQEAVKRADRDGEAILRFFHVGDGGCQVRFVEPEHVKSPDGRPQSRFGIETEQDDVESVKGYWIVEKPDYDQSPSFVEADEVLHIKVNADSSAKRGVPTMNPVKKNLERADNLLKNMSTLAAVRATYAVLRKHKKFSASAVSAYQQSNADLSVNNPSSVTGPSSTFMKRLMPGSIIDASDDTDYEFPSADVDASSLVEILQAELRAIASRLVMPEYMLTSDASNANYASTMVAEAPSTRNFERLQAFFARRFGDGAYESPTKSGAIWRAIRYAVDYGTLSAAALTEIEIQAEGPTIVARDKDKETNRAKTLKDSGILSKPTWAKWEGLDYDQEVQQGAGRGDDDQINPGGGGDDQQPPDDTGPGGDDGDFLDFAEEVGEDSTSPFDPVAVAKEFVASVYKAAGEEMPDLYEDAAGKATARLAESCVTNHDGTGHHDDKTGHPCTTGGGDSTSDKPSLRSRFQDLMKSAAGKLSEKARAIAGKVKAAAVAKFKTYEAKYGRKGAIAVMAAMVALTPIPAPGTSFAPVLIAEAVRHVAKFLRSRSTTEGLLEGCVPNKSGKGHHDDKTGHPCTLGKGQVSSGHASAFLSGSKVGIDSSAVKAAQFDPTKESLTIHFSDGTSYDYHDVSKVEAEAFAHSDSKGLWINRNLKGISFKEAVKLAPPPPVTVAQATRKPRSAATDIGDKATKDVAIAGRTGRANQVVAEGNQIIVAAALGHGHESVPGNAPMDVHRVEPDGSIAHGVECKTLLESKTGQVHMDDAAFARKEYWRRGLLLVPESKYNPSEHGPALGREQLYDEDRKANVTYRVVKDKTTPRHGERTVHMAVIDHRDEWAEVLGGAGDTDERKWGRRQVYYARHFGSVGIGREGPPPLICCDNPDVYRSLMSKSDDEVQKIAEQHQYGQLSYPSGKPVPQRGAKLAPRDVAAQTYTDVVRWRQKAIAARVSLASAISKQMDVQSALKKLKAKVASPSITDQERRREWSHLGNLARAENAIKLGLPKRMAGARARLEKYQAKLERGQPKWDNMRQKLPPDHPLANAR